MPSDFSFIHWSGQVITGKDLEDVVYDLDDEPFIRLRVPQDKMYLGFAPVPKSRWQWLTHDYHHGRLMQYPLLSVLVYCVRAFLRNGRKYNDNAYNS